MQPLTMPFSLTEVPGPSEILRISQKAAGANLAALGLAGEAEAQGLVWVIIRTRCQLFSQPGKDGTAVTWPGATRTGMMPRYCELYDPAGSLTARIVTTWVLADDATRQLRLDSPIPVPDLSRGDEPAPARSLPRKELPFLRAFTPSAAQIDENGHMNNAAYLDAAMDAAGELIPGREITAFAVDYRAEILPGTEIGIYGAVEGNILHLSGKTAEKEHFRMTLTWK